MLYLLAFLPGTFQDEEAKPLSVKDFDFYMHIFGSIPNGNLSLNCLHKYRVNQNELIFLLCPMQIQVTARRLSFKKKKKSFSPWFCPLNREITCFLLSAFCLLCFVFAFFFPVLSMALVLNANERKT